MNKKSSLIVLSATIVLTLFFAALACVYNPYRESAVFSSEVKAEAENRQNQSIVSVSEPLDTDLSSREDDDKLAQRVASKLTDDDSFMTAVGDRSVEYVAARMEDIESRYASSTDEKIAAAEESVRSDIRSTDEIASELLSNETFMSAIEEAVMKKLGEEYDAEQVAETVVSSEAFKKALEDALSTGKSGSVPVPAFSSSSPSVSYSEEEYKAARNAERESELERVMSFLGY